MKMIRIRAIRGGSDGDGDNSLHNQRIEIGGQTSNSITPVQRITLYSKLKIIAIGKKKRKLKLQDQRVKAGVGMKTMGNGLESGNSHRESASALWMSGMRTLTSCS